MMQIKYDHFSLWSHRHTGVIITVFRSNFYDSDFPVTSAQPKICYRKYREVTRFGPSGHVDMVCRVSVRGKSFVSNRRNVM